MRALRSVPYPSNGSVTPPPSEPPPGTTCACTRSATSRATGERPCRRSPWVMARYEATSVTAHSQAPRSSPLARPSARPAWLLPDLRNSSASSRLTHASCSSTRARPRLPRREWTARTTSFRRPPAHAESSRATTASAAFTSTIWSSAPGTACCFRPERSSLTRACRRRTWSSGGDGGRRSSASGATPSPSRRHAAIPCNATPPSLTPCPHAPPHHPRHLRPVPDLPPSRPRAPAY